MSSKQPVIFGEVLYDCFEEDGRRVLGGAPFNVAWHLKGFGLQPLFISRVGDDALGHEIAATMQQWGMQTDGLQWDREHPTGEVSIRLKDGQPSFHILPGQAYDYIDVASLPTVNPLLLYHGSLGLRAKGSAAALQSLITGYRPAVFLDVNLRAPWWNRTEVLALFEHSRWLKINDEELQALEAGESTLEQKARVLLQRYALEMLIVTLGAEGAMCFEQSGSLHKIAPAASTRVVDTVGAGDAFAAVSILGIASQWPLPLTLERAQGFASLIVGQRGATLADAGVYERLLSDWEN